jgi:prepilin-type N-terminal cleavage/methylation domain-containing protein
LAGFTLLELITVVAISGVLMALLLPALSSAKEKSRRSVCGQNERQVIFALIMYGSDNRELLPSATDNTGVGYHSIVLSGMTFSNILDYTANESNVLYCPNLLQSTAKMGGYNPNTGFTIGYSYLATTELPGTPKGPDTAWTGPMNTTEASEVIADANYWSKTTTQALTVAPHTTSGSVAMTMTLATASTSSASATSTSQAAGSSSTAVGGAGGNVGSLDGSVIWEPIGRMGIYPASQDSSASGNW